MPLNKRAVAPRDAHATSRHSGKWDGPTYYGRPQLKAAPFNNWVVGGYIFLAGLSGAGSLIATIADLAGDVRSADTVRRGRYLSLLAPTLGSALLVYDLHTPKRFYNMLRIAKATSPMSIGTWILMTFSGFAGVTAFAQFVADCAPRLAWLRRLARVSQVPAAVAGAGLGTYTASLLSATSTPLWAAAPQSLAVRFGSSSVASGAAALTLLERAPTSRRVLDALSVAALAIELAATAQSHITYRRVGVEQSLQGRWGSVDRNAATRAGVILPLGLHVAAMTLGRQGGVLSRVAAVSALGGSLLLRVAFMAAGDVSATKPEISFRFSQPANLPKPQR